MRFLHLADTHLGFRQFAGRLDPERGINQREADVYRAWHHAMEFAVASGVDAVVHAGDLFDGPRPTPRALSEALDGFARLHAAGIPAIVIAGNHSTPRTRSGGSVFEVIGRFPGVHAVWEAPRRIDLGGTSFHAVPHADDGAVPLLDLGPGRNVLIAHGGIDAARATYSEPGAVELDRAAASTGVDYAALGHLHAFARVGSNAVYAGSLERLDFADESAKVLVVADLEGSLSVVPAPFRPVFTVVVACARARAGRGAGGRGGGGGGARLPRRGRAAAAGRVGARRLSGTRPAARERAARGRAALRPGGRLRPGCRRARRRPTRASRSRPSRGRGCRQGSMLRGSFRSRAGSCVAAGAEEVQREA